jgi:hypothetical protein
LRGAEYEDGTELKILDIVDIEMIGAAPPISSTDGRGVRPGENGGMRPVANESPTGRVAALMVCSELVNEIAGSLKMTVGNVDTHPNEGATSHTRSWTMSA